MGAFCCHGNQTKVDHHSFLTPYQSDILTKLGTNFINGFGGVVA